MPRKVVLPQSLLVLDWTSINPRESELKKNDAIHAVGDRNRHHRLAGTALSRDPIKRVMEQNA